MRDTTPTGPQAQEAGVQRIEEAPLYWKFTKQDAATGYCNGWNDCLAAVAETATPARVVSDELFAVALQAWVQHQADCRITTVEGSLRKALQAALSTLQSGAEGKDGEVLRDALAAVVRATRAYLPPDGISPQDCISLVLAATDNARINAVLGEIE